MDDQLSPSGFIHDELKPMTQSSPWQAVRQAQNHTALHDSPNTMHVLLLNTELAKLDRMTYWGLANDLSNAVDELVNMPPFQSYKKDLDRRIEKLKQAGIALNVNNAEELLHKIKNTGVSNPKNFSADVRKFLTEDSKKKAPGERNLIPTDKGTKAKFVEQLFKKVITPEFLGVQFPEPTENTPEAKAKAKLQTQAIKETVENFTSVAQWMIADRIAEASEARAMRAVVCNALETMDLSQFKSFEAPEAAEEDSSKPSRHQGSNCCY